MLTRYFQDVYDEDEPERLSLRNERDFPQQNRGTVKSIFVTNSDLMDV